MVDESDTKKEKNKKKKMVVSVNEQMLEEATKRWRALGFSSQSEYISHLIRMDLYPMRKE